MSVYSEVEFFLTGFKPALLLPRKQFEKLTQKKPFLLKFPRALQGDSCVIIFQNRALRKSFLEQVVACARENYMSVLGKSLGYPPSAAEQFRHFRIHEDRRFHVHYYGIHFITISELLIENLNWLIDTYPVPEGYPGKVYIEDFHPRVTPFYSRETLQEALQKNELWSESSLLTIQWPEKIKTRQQEGSL